MAKQEELKIESELRKEDDYKPITVTYEVEGAPEAIENAVKEVIENVKDFVQQIKDAYEV